MDRLTDLQAGARWAPALRALGDERLANMVEGGSDPAFAAIYGRYAPVLHGYCRSLLRDEEEAGDALQNAMLKALQAMRRAGRSGPLRPWLFRIAHNESVTILRQRARRPGVLDESLVAGADDAFRRAAAREQLAALLEDMQHLTEHQRGALVMRELGGLSYDEIGSALETTPLAARQAVFAARKRLRDGIVPVRRLRPALRQLIPAPGFAVFGLLGAGGGKAVLIGTAAAVSVGVGSVELAVQAPSPSHHSTAVAEAIATPAPAKHHAETRRATVAPTATAAPAAATSTARAPVRVRARRVAATVSFERTATSTSTHRTRAPKKTVTRAPARDDEPSGRPVRPAPASPAPVATTAPAPATTAQPVATTAPATSAPARPSRPTAAPVYTAAVPSGDSGPRDSRRDCPQGQHPDGGQGGGDGSGGDSSGPPVG